MLNKQLIDEEFGFLGDNVYLNVSARCMPPKRVQTAYCNYMSNYVSNLGIDVSSKSWEFVNNGREKIAKLINASSHEIAFTKNTSEATSIIANGFPFLPGDNIVIADEEHPSNMFPWINMHMRKGLNLNVVPSSEDNIDVDALIGAIDDHTRILTVSAVQYGSGFAVDLQKLGNACYERGIVFMVDGIQAIGRLNIDVKKMHIDVLTAGGHKGFLATFGAGVLYCSDRIVTDILPTYASLQSVTNFSKLPAKTTNFENLDWFPNARKFEAGNPNFNGILAIATGVDLILELGIQNIDAHIRELEIYLRKKLKDIPLHVMESKDPSNWGGVICVYYPKGKENSVKEILNKHKIICTMRNGYIRFSIDFYNTVQHMDIVVDALKEISLLKDSPELK